MKNEDKMVNIIYGLRDPRNDVYQYVGKSTVGLRRPLEHLTNSHSKRVNDWVKMLGSNWQYPLIDIIEEVEKVEVLVEREKYWINYYYNLNPDLLNFQEKKITIQNIRDEEHEKNVWSLIRILGDAPRILKSERLYRNMTQKEMADAMGVSRSTVSLCENGCSVRLDTIRSYVRALKGVDILTKSHRERPKRNLNNELGGGFYTL